MLAVQKKMFFLYYSVPLSYLFFQYVSNNVIVIIKDRIIYFPREATLMFLDSIAIIHPAFVTFTFAIHRNAQTTAIAILLHLHMNAIRLPIAEDNSSQSEYPFNTVPRCDYVATITLSDTFSLMSQRKPSTS